MLIKKVAPHRYLIGDGMVIVESHPPRRQKEATKELLSDDLTASHYYEGIRKVSVDGVPTDKVGVDALGKPIKIGEKMDYIDWKSDDRVWTVYAPEEFVEEDKNGNKVKIKRNMPQGTFKEEDAALSHAVEIHTSQKKGVK